MVVGTRGGIVKTHLLAVAFALLLPVLGNVEKVIAGGFCWGSTPVSHMLLRRRRKLLV